MQTPVHWQLFRRTSATDDQPNQSDRTAAMAIPAGIAPVDSQVFECTFEDAVDALAKLPGMFIEMDGSFVLRRQASDTDYWQIDGMIYDRDLEVSPGQMRESRVHWCDIRGVFSVDIWTSVWKCFSTPIEDLVVYDVAAQTYLAPSELFAN